MRMRGLMVMAALILLVPASQAAAQQTYGDGFGIGGVFLPSGSGALLGTTRIGDDLGLEFALELRVSDDGNRSTTTLGAGIGLKKYLTDRKQFQPFYGGRFGFLHTSRTDGDFDSDDTRFGVTAVLGGEYFVVRSISLEAEIGFDLYFGSVELGTSTRLAALFYL